MKCRAYVHSRVTVIVHTVPVNQIRKLLANIWLEIPTCMICRIMDKVIPLYFCRPVVSKCKICMEESAIFTFLNVSVLKPVRPMSL